MANQYDTNLKLQAIADAIGDTQSSGLISALEDIADAVAGGGGGGSAAAGLVSDNFSDTDTYDLGDYCIHNNTLYVCINAIVTPGAWDLSDWQATNAGLELSSLNSALTALENKQVYPTDGNNIVLGYMGAQGTSPRWEVRRAFFKSTGTGARTFNTGIPLSNIINVDFGLAYNQYFTSPYYTSASDWWNAYMANGVVNLRGNGTMMTQSSTLYITIDYVIPL